MIFCGFIVKFLLTMNNSFSNKTINLALSGNKLTGSVPRDLCRPEINSDFFSKIPDSQDRDYCDSIACPVSTAAFEGVYPCSPCRETSSNPYLGRVGECIDLSQEDILKAFYEATSFSGQWKGNVNWNDDGVPVCSYTGVTCDVNGDIISIELRDRGLTGSIPDEIGFLKYLQVLDLADNKLQGFVPSDLRLAPLNSLDISGNKIRGIIPPKLCFKEGINGNGENGDYNCQRLACPVGTYSLTGREGADYSMCKPCADGSIFLGQKECMTNSMKKGVHGPHDKGMNVNGIVGITAVLVIVGVAVSFFIALRMRQMQAKRGHAVATSEYGSDGALRANTVGVSSLPGSEIDSYYSKQAALEEGSSLPGSESHWSIRPKKKSNGIYLQPNTVGESSFPDTAEDIKFPIPAKGRPASKPTYRPTRGTDSVNESIKASAFPTGNSSRNISRKVKGASDAEAAALARAASVFGGDEKKDSLQPSTKQSEKKNEEWDYPDPNEQSPGNSVEDDDWKASPDSSKEVWLDVPKI